MEGHREVDTEDEGWRGIRGGGKRDGGRLDRSQG